MASSTRGWARGGWAQRKAATTPVVALTPGIDPEHSNPTANIDVAAGTPMWVQSTPMPALPAQMTQEPFRTPTHAGVGPVNHTPLDPEFGTGVGHGQTIEEAQEVRTEWMSLDYGAVAAHEWQPLTDRDGSPTAVLIEDTPGDGDSPQTLQLERTGVGQPNDPFARVGKRLQRAWQRVWDMHRWDVELRPTYARNAYEQPNQPPVATGGQYDSPYASLAWMSTQDRFVHPQTRRSPTLWSPPSSAQADQQAAESALAEQLVPSWGL